MNEKQQTRFQTLYATNQNKNCVKNFFNKTYPIFAFLAYIDDLFDTINGKKVLIPRRQPSNKGAMITHKSTISEIQAWLKEKRFSQRFVAFTNNKHILILEF